VSTSGSGITNGKGDLDAGKEVLLTTEAGGPRVVQTVSAQVLDATVVLRVTVAVPEIRSKPVPVRFTMTAELAKAFLQQFGTVVAMAELHKRQRPSS
jgi:hypothetical protein